jgi:hypothetical protein
MNKLISFVRKAVGAEQTVDKIMAPITKIASKLEAHEAAQKGLVAANRDAIKRAEAAADAAALAASTAASKRAKMLETFA